MHGSRLELYSPNSTTEPKSIISLWFTESGTPVQQDRKKLLLPSIYPLVMIMALTRQKVRIYIFLDTERELYLSSSTLLVTYHILLMKKHIKRDLLF